jgi:hypothetical protein
MVRIFIILSCMVFCTLTYASSVDSICQTRHCLAVVDAGSTGSRLHIYAYDFDETNTPVQITQLWSKKITPGLATIDPKQEIINAYIERLFTDAPAHDIPVYFYATAGMRLISQEKQATYYQIVQQWFASHSDWTLLDAKTIPGKYEGLLGWLSMNYQLGTLQDPEKPLTGVMDMGGASVQIAFPVTQLDVIDAQDVVDIHLYERHIQLFTHSFLGLGQTEVSHQYLNTESCFSKDYPLPNESFGEGDASRCQHEITHLINDVHHVKQLVQPVIASNPVSSWHAMSGVINLVQSKPFVFQDAQFSNEEMLQQADASICHQSWSVLNALYPDNNYLFINCLSASYYASLMVDGYGLAPKEPIHYASADNDTDWTLGVVLYQSR